MTYAQIWLVKKKSYDYYVTCEQKNNWLISKGKSLQCVPISLRITSGLSEKCNVIVLYMSMAPCFYSILK